MTSKIVEIQTSTRPSSNDERKFTSKSMGTWGLMPFESASRLRRPIISNCWMRRAVRAIGTLCWSLLGRSRNMPPIAIVRPSSSRIPRTYKQIMGVAGFILIQCFRSYPDRRIRTCRHPIFRKSPKYITAWHCDVDPVSEHLALYTPLVRSHREGANIRRG